MVASEGKGVEDGSRMAMGLTWALTGRALESRRSGAAEGRPERLIAERMGAAIGWSAQRDGEPHGFWNKVEARPK